jgi:hypothetical protein
MPHHSARTRRDQFFETDEGEPTILPRQASVPSVCKPACRPSESVGSLPGVWLIDTWSEPS